MDFLLWTCLVLGLLGAISLALGGLGLEQGDAFSSAGDIAEIGEFADLADAGDFGDLADMADAGEAHEAFESFSETALVDRLQHAELGHLTEVLDRVQRQESLSQTEPTPHMRPVSSFTIFAFLASFGIVGLALRFFAHGLAESAILLGAVVGGFGVAWVVWRMLDKLLFYVESDSTPREHALLGRLAEVSFPVPEGGVTEVIYEIGGTRLQGPAKNSTGQPLERGEKVRLAGREGPLFKIESLSRRDLEFLNALSEVESELLEQSDESPESQSR